MGKKLDLVNQIFGKLTVLREVPGQSEKMIRLLNGNVNVNVVL